MDPFQIPLYPSWSKLDDLNGHFLEEHIIRTTSPEIEQVNGMPPKSDSSLRLKSTTTRRREVSGRMNPYPTTSPVRSKTTSVASVIQLPPQDPNSPLFQVENSENSDVVVEEYMEEVEVVSVNIEGVLQEVDLQGVSLQEEEVPRQFYGNASTACKGHRKV
eukprot:GHVP01042513.1.p1 GENE.GHVP01042513.1~~GHVP01042513.1.p1  ORF type:complete len:168 (-),score=16.82 GHVP01042513.1:165-647(-)